MHATNILLVDDEPSVVCLCETILTIHGYIVDTACNGLEAISKFHNHDILVTDILMPIMDGWELIRRIRLINKSICIVAMSGYEQYEHENYTQKYHCHFIAKPFDLIVFYNRLKTWHAQDTIPHEEQSLAQVR